MSEIFMDVDAALTEVPVNILPLLDDTDFKTREVAIAYDAAGMDLVWNFVTSAGAYTQTAVTPTTAGTYDWAHQGDGMYSIEIPASGGASINNDTEGYGWFTGVITGVLLFRGPIITFRAANTNDLMVDSTFSWDKIVLPVGPIPALGIIENGLLQSATSSSIIVFRAGTALGDDVVNNAVVEVVAGTGIGQTRLLVDFTGATDTGTVDPAFGVTLDNTSHVIIRAAAPAPTALAALPYVDVRGWLGTVPATPTVAGVPEVDLTHVAGATTNVSTIATAIAAIQALLDDARGEPGQGNPPVNPDAMTKLDYLYKAFRNRSTQTATEYALYADDGTTKDHEAACSDDGTTFIRGELATGA